MAAVARTPSASFTRSLLHHAMQEALQKNDLSVFVKAARGLGIGLPPDAGGFETWGVLQGLVRLTQEVPTRPLSIVTCASRTFLLRAAYLKNAPLEPQEEAALDELRRTLQPHLARISPLLMGFVEGTIRLDELGTFPALMAYGAPVVTFPQFVKLLGNDVVRTLGEEPNVAGTDGASPLRQYLDDLTRVLATKGLTLEEAASRLGSAYEALRDAQLSSTPLSKLIEELWSSIIVCLLDSP